MVQMAKFGPFPAPKWFNMVPTEFQASVFFIGNQYCFTEIHPNIDI